LKNEWSIANEVRRILGCRELTTRDLAAQMFYRHCLKEGWSLASTVSAVLNDWSLEVLGAFSATRWSEDLGRRLGPFTSDRLFDSHCLAITSAIGLGAMRGIANFPEQAMAWKIHRLIVASDVGEKNVGRPCSPWGPNGMHILFRPGAFEGGTASQQQSLLRLYERKPAALDKLVVLLVSIGALSPTSGIETAIFEHEQLGGGMIGASRVGTTVPEGPITEWNSDFVIKDAGAALSDLPKRLVDQLLLELESVNSFWPQFSERHRLSW
jgi:hypothetical protein